MSKESERVQMYQQKERERLGNKEYRRRQARLARIRRERPDVGERLRADKRARSKALHALAARHREEFQEILQEVKNDSHSRIS